MKRSADSRRDRRAPGGQSSDRCGAAGSDRTRRGAPRPSAPHRLRPLP